MTRDWMVSAKCRGMDPEVFFPSATGVAGRQQVAKAAAVCAACPVRVECQEYADANEESCGVWGGWPRAGRLKTVQFAPAHGTEAMLARHRRRGEKCGICEGMRVYARRGPRG